MPVSDALTSEFDAPWKIALRLYLRQILAFCFPAVYELIDWREPPVFLDNELQQIAPSHQQGRRVVDCLVRVRLLTGRYEWLFIHLEIQAQPEAQFSQRLWVCFYRIWDRYGQEVISLVVLADDDPQWRPRWYELGLGGRRMKFEFPVFKVLDCADPEGDYERTGNVAALLVAAQQVALRTRHDTAARCAGRLRLVKHLYAKGLKREEVVNLFRLLSWLTKLPEDWELQFREELANFEQTEARMTIETLLSPIELMAMEKGRQEGRQEGQVQMRRLDILEALGTRFGPISQEVHRMVDSLSDEASLSCAFRRAVTAASLEVFLSDLKAGRG